MKNVALFIQTWRKLVLAQMYFIRWLINSKGRGFLISDWLFTGFLSFHLGKEVNLWSFQLRSELGGAHVPCASAWSSPRLIRSRQTPWPWVCGGLLCAWAGSPLTQGDSISWNYAALGFVSLLTSLCLFSTEYCRPTVHYRNSKES